MTHASLRSGKDSDFGLSEMQLEGLARMCRQLASEDTTCRHQRDSNISAASRRGTDSDFGLSDVHLEELARVCNQLASEGTCELGSTDHTATDEPLEQIQTVLAVRPDRPSITDADQGIPTLSAVEEDVAELIFGLCVDHDGEGIMSHDLIAACVKYPYVAAFIGHTCTAEASDEFSEQITWEQFRSLVASRRRAQLSATPPRLSQEEELDLIFTI